MKVKMKEYEKMCIDYASKHKSWEAKCIAKDAWLAAWKTAKDTALVKVNQPNSDYELAIGFMGNDEVEVEFKDGEHQLNEKDSNER